MEKRPWFEIAEYTAIVGSVVGTVAAVKFQQLAYASTPLAVVVSLNLINRQRFQQQIQQYTSSAIADVRQVVQPLFQPANIPVQNINLGSIAGLLPPTDQLTSTASNDQELMIPLRQAPQKEVIIELQSITAEIHQGFDKLANCLEPGNFADIKLEISTIKEHLQTVDITYIKSNVEQLKAQFNRLDEQHHSLPPACDILALAEKMTYFEQRNQELLRDYNNLLVPKVTQLESDQASSKQDIKSIKEQLSSLEKKLEDLSLSPEANFSNVVKAIAPIQAHISSIGSIPEQITQLKLELQDLQEQILYESPYHQNGYKKN
ncbi:MAG TPA: hypothetical protein V6D15_13110 [Oculatellaceae cyanobacterium]|jgi:predicted  nucleic acid-binding Zn-ribbon protein